MILWTVYDHPPEYPAWYVARQFVFGHLTTSVLLGRTLEEVRSKLPDGLMRMERAPEDDPTIVESWL